ncbi:MAG: hypothetical protein R6U41_02530 [Desulfosalsimonas sp.]|uniref:hypothetical protein n=1 Tax=Desulfosalsimonas sp. TaxID=3073848 RepID=UPI0039708BB7
MAFNLFAFDTIRVYILGAEGYEYISDPVDAPEKTDPRKSGGIRFIKHSGGFDQPVVPEKMIDAHNFGKNSNMIQVQR